MTEYEISARIAEINVFCLWLLKQPLSERTAPDLHKDIAQYAASRVSELLARQ